MIAAAALAVSALVGTCVSASPINVAAQIAPRALKDSVQYVTIHESCNATQRRMIERGLNETWEVVEFAQQYAIRNGPDDEAFKMYFGEEKENYAKVLGVYESILYSNKENVIFRCDDIDGNCGQPGWRGHWRGDNATTETVICDASYTDRRYNTAMCMFGWNLAAGPVSTFWSVDLLHRLLHVPQVTNDAVHHYIEEGAKLAGVTELAEHNATYSPFDSDALQYYAAHVYINEVVGGGDSCIGNIEEAAHSHGDASHGAATSSSPAASATSAAASSAPAQTSAAASQDCHTHADGTVHCV